MALLGERCRMDILSASGMLRVTITPQFNLGVALDAALFLVIAVVVWNQRPMQTGQLVFAVVYAVLILGWFGYQLAGSEEIEFNQQSLSLRKNRPPFWSKTVEYPLRDCTRLEIYTPGKNESDRLRFDVGGKRVTFGADLNEAQATNILAELQRALPQEADRLMAAADPFDQHFTLLNLR